MNNDTKDQINDLLLNIVTDTIVRTRKNLSQEKKPFHSALLDNEVIKLSAFERSFSTSFGQKYVEQISLLIADETADKAGRQKTNTCVIFQGANDNIETILANLKTNISKPNWNREVRDVTAYDRGRTIIRDVISDLWFIRNEKEHFFSIKTAKPNFDQTSIAKRDMLILKAFNKNFETFFALYYNPTGNLQTDYTYSMPFKYFDMQKDPCVLIGRDYWDFIGGPGTYDQLIKIFNDVGNHTIKQVKNMHL